MQKPNPRRIIASEMTHWYSAKEPPPLDYTVLGQTKDIALGTVPVYRNSRGWWMAAYGERYRGEGVDVVRWCFMPGSQREQEIADR